MLLLGLVQHYSTTMRISSLFDWVSELRTLNVIAHQNGITLFSRICRLGLLTEAISSCDGDVGLNDVT